MQLPPSASVPMRERSATSGIIAARPRRRRDARKSVGRVVFDLMKLTTGSSALLGLHSDTVQAVCKQFAANRNAARRRPHWRGKKSLGWIPFAPARAVKLDGDAVIYLKRRYRLWRSRPTD